MRDLGDALIITICLVAFFAAGAWLEQKGKSKDSDYHGD